jgi:transposase-like protein
LRHATTTKDTTVTDDRMALIEQIQKSTDGDFQRSVAEHTLHRLMDFEVEGLIGAARHERTGSRPRQLDTRLGTLDLKIPKLRQGSYFPGFPGAAQDGREGAHRCHPGSVDSGRLNPQGR